VNSPPDSVRFSSDAANGNAPPSSSSSNPHVPTSVAAPPPPLPTGLCCMSGCANCVWLDYADEIVSYYLAKGEKLGVDSIMKEVDDNVSDEMVKAFIKMEIKFKYRKKS
jgi:hypothetical protein